MPTYTYRAVDEDGKEVHGSLEAPDPISAKTAIEDLHLELIDIAEAMRIRAANVPAASNLITFSFEGKDSGGSVHRGSVQAASKREAFDSLTRGQGLHMSVLAPVGAPIPETDPELAQWQPQSTAQSTRVTPTKAPEHVDEPVFINIPEMTVASKSSEPTVQPEPEAPQISPKYTSLFLTLRLYAGWLLAWYGLFVACGYYSYVRQLPFEIPAAEGFFFSPLILSFIIAIYLYLVLHSIHRALSGRLVLGGLLSVVGVGMFVFLRMNLA